MATDIFTISDLKEVENCYWYPIISLDKNWLGKWASSENGYTLLLTDGVNFWCEKRDSNYIQSKSILWADCIDAEIEKLSSLILSQFKEDAAKLKLTKDSQNNLQIELTATLDCLHYSWHFYLSLLPSNLIQHHWILPIAAIFEFMHLRIKKLEEEVNKKQKLLDELLPNKSNSKKTSYDTLLDTSLSNVLSKGTGSIISSHLSTCPEILQLFSSKRMEVDDSAGKNQTPATSNRYKPKKPVRGCVLGDEEALFPQADSKEMERREQIKNYTLNPAPYKKKKKLNI